MFNKKELDLLAAAYQTFVGRIHVFDVLSEKKWSATGIENWIQTEFIVALIDRGYEVTTIGKAKRDCDIIVKEEKSGLDVGIEIRALTSLYYKWLIGGLSKHPYADLYLFLSKVDNDMLKELNDYFEQYGYIKEYRMLNEHWMLMLVKKVNTTETPQSLGCNTHHATP